MKQWLDISKGIAFFNRLSKRERLIAIGAFGIVFVLVTDQLVIRQIFKSLQSLDQQAKDLENSIKKSVRMLSQKERMLAEIEKYKTYSVEIKSPEEETGALLKHIEELANQSSVNLLYAKPAGSRPDETIKKFIVSLECEGQMAQMVKFFYEVENSNLLLKIDKFTLQPTAAGSSVVKCGATVSRAVVS
jgi:Tfp pilus assembly protein PilO